MNVLSLVLIISKFEQQAGTEPEPELSDLFHQSSYFIAMLVDSHHQHHDVGIMVLVVGITLALSLIHLTPAACFDLS